MIVGCDGPLEVGQRSQGVSDGECRRHPEQPFVVLREATAAEYLAEAAAAGMTFSPDEVAWYRQHQYFYEVSVD